MLFRKNYRDNRFRGQAQTREPVSFPEYSLCKNKTTRHRDKAISSLSLLNLGTYRNPFFVFFLPLQ